MEAPLRTGLAHALVAAVGPVTAKEAARFGMEPAIMPGRVHSMKPLVNEIALSVLRSALPMRVSVMSSELTEKICTPCRGGIPPMALDEAKRFLEQTPDWTLVSDGKRIERTSDSETLRKPRSSWSGSAP